MYWFSCTKKEDVALIKEDAAGISKPRNLLNQKLEGFKHLHSPNDDLPRTIKEYCISDTKTAIPHTFNLTIPA